MIKKQREKPKMADVLLDAFRKQKPLKQKQSIKQVRETDLINILEQLEEENQLTNFFQNLKKEKSINVEEIEKYVQKEMDDLRYNMGSIIAKIYIQKHQDPSFLQYIENNEDDLSKLQRHMTIINSPGYYFHIRGEISNISWLKNKTSLSFTIKQKDENNQYKVTAYINSFVSTLVIQSIKYVLFEDLLFQVQRNQPIIDLNQTTIRVKTDKFKSLSESLPDGVYNIRIFYNQDQLIQRVIFFDVMSNQMEFRISQDTDKSRVVSCNQWRRTLFYRQFIKMIQIVKRERRDVRFKDEKQSNNCLKLKKPTGNTGQFDPIVIYDKINQQKTAMIQMLQEEQMSNILIILIDKLISVDEFEKQTEFMNEIYNRHQFENIYYTLNSTRQLYAKIGQSLTIEQILKQVLIQTNYSLLVPKVGTVDTVRLVRLLSEAQKKLKLIQGKDIIAFYGCTGSGKSTSVNYLMGIPLIKQNGSYGDKVIKIDEEKYLELVKESLQKRQFADIGHKIGTSQTIYSQAHQFIESTVSESLKSSIKNIVLCDNPGFNDTRGKQYEVCTNMSIDMAVEKSQSIRAIVLTIPYANFTTQKSNNIFSLLNTLEERYPQLMMQNTDLHKIFHILITKWTSNKEQQTFRERLIAHIQQQEQQKTNARKDNRNAGATVNRRLNIYQMLLSMWDQDRIKFINVTDNFCKENLLALYTRQSNVSKQCYRRFLENGDQRDEYYKQLSKSAHTWTVMLLYPFKNTIPDLLTQTEKMIETLGSDIRQRQNRIIEVQNFRKQSEQNIRILRRSQAEFDKSKSLDLNSTTTILELDGYQTIMQQNKKQYQNRLQNQNKKLAANKEKLNTTLTDLKGKTHELQKQKKKNSELQQTIDYLRKGSKIQQIYSLRYQYGERIYFNANRPREQRQKSFKNFIELKELEDKGVFVVGKQNIELLYLPIISRQYSLIPNQKFDPSAYMKCHNDNTAFSSTKYKASFKSQGVILHNMGNSTDGKKIILDIEVKFVVCKDESELPFLSITHEIPNEEANSSAIQNKKSELKKGIEAFNTLDKQIRSIQKLVDSYKKDVQSNEKLIATTKQELNKQNQNHENMIKGHFDKQIKKQLQNANEYTKNIQQLKLTNSKSQASIKQSKQNYETYKFTYRRIAFLIKDQLEDKIPQSLKILIENALQVYEKYEKGQKPLESQKQDQILNFEKFVGLLQDSQEKIRTNIQNVLQDKRYGRAPGQELALRIHEGSPKKMFEVAARDIQITQRQRKNQVSPPKVQKSNQEITKRNTQPQIPQKRGGVCDCCKII